MILKRLFDICLAVVAIVVLAIPMLVIWFVSAYDTKSSGIFIQIRIGRYGKPFSLFKFQTIAPQTRLISNLGNFLRNSRLDELPQLINILKGDMSVVGPRPDLPGYYDKLTGEDRNILNLRPGLTSVAAIKYRNENAILAQQENPLEYNDTVLFPDKVRMNLEYSKKISLSYDVVIIVATVIPFFRKYLNDKV